MRLIPLLCVLLGAMAHAEDRVAAARRARQEGLVQALSAAGVPWPPEELYVRAFKLEREVEVWAGARGRPLVRVKVYPVCAASGELGPKRREGDLQVPEGFYLLDSFNPYSSFHLSMRVSYPNAADRRLSDARRPGGNIAIHGSCASIGCIAIEDGPIEELYLLAWEARRRMGREVPIHIFPSRLSEQGLAALEQHPHATPERVAFWRSLQPGYLLFEQSRRPPRVSVDPRSGAYKVRVGR